MQHSLTLKTKSPEAEFIQSTPLPREQRPFIRWFPQIRANIEHQLWYLPNPSGFMITDNSPAHQKLFLKNKNLQIVLKYGDGSIYRIFHLLPEFLHWLADFAQLICIGRRVLKIQGRRIGFTGRAFRNCQIRQSFTKSAKSKPDQLKEFYNRKNLRKYLRGMPNGLMKADTTRIFKLLIDLFEFVCGNRKITEDDMKLLKKADAIEKS